MDMNREEYLESLILKALKLLEDHEGCVYHRTEAAEAILSRFEDTEEERVARTANTINDLLLGKDVTPPTKAEEDEMTDHIAETFKKEQALIYKKDMMTNSWMDLIKRSHL